MARLFNGTSDRITVALNLSTYNKVALAFWLYKDANADDDHLAAEFTADAAQNNGFQVNPDYSGVAGNFHAYMGSGGGAFKGTRFARPSAGAWHHVLANYDRPAGTVTVYIDGVVPASTATSGGSFNTGTNFANSTLYLMSRLGTSLFTAGRMAEMALWAGVTLTAAEAATLAAGTWATAVQPASLVDYLRITGRESPEPDYSGNSGPSGTVTTPAYVDGPPWTLRREKASRPQLVYRRQNK